MFILSPTAAALLGSAATAIAIFAGGLAVEAYKRGRDRVGMALALAGAIDAMIGLIETRGMVSEIADAHDRLERGERVAFAGLIGDNAPFEAVTLSYRDQLGHLGGDLPFRVARFLVFNHGLLRDLDRLRCDADLPQTQAALIRRMDPLWTETRALGAGLVADLRRVGVGRRARGDRGDVAGRKGRP